MAPKTRTGSSARARKVERDEPLLTELLRLLDEATGLHSRLAKETGVPQTVVSRTYQRKGEPRLTSADSMLTWLRDNRSRFDELRLEHALRRVESIGRRRADPQPGASSEATRTRIAAFDPRAQGAR